MHVANVGSNLLQIPRGGARAALVASREHPKLGLSRAMVSYIDQRIISPIVTDLYALVSRFVAPGGALNERRRQPDQHDHRRLSRNSSRVSGSRHDEITP